MRNNGVESDRESRYRSNTRNGQLQACECLGKGVQGGKGKEMGKREEKTAVNLSK